MAAAVYAEDEESDGVDGKAEGPLPKIPEPAGGEGDRVNKPDPTRLGKLLCGRELESVLFIYQRLGSKENPAPHDACPKAQRFRLEAME